MRCRSCRESFGLSLELGFENESAGKCALCQNDICFSCSRAPGIDTQSDIEPVRICTSCIRRLGEASQAAVA